MAFWSVHSHKSRAETKSLKVLDHLEDDVRQVKLVLGNDKTENTLVYDVAAVKKSKSDRVEVETIRRDLVQVRKMRGPDGLGWLSGEGAPAARFGRIGEFYLSSTTLDVYKKLNAGWVSFITLKGTSNPSTSGGTQGPFHLLPYIDQNAYFYIFIHPSRFASIGKTSWGTLTATDILDFTGKSIAVSGVEVSKDEHHHITLGGGGVISISERFDRLFENNKAFAIFQVFQLNTSDPNDLSIKPFSLVTAGSLFLSDPNRRHRVVSFTGQPVIPTLGVGLYSQEIVGEKFTSHDLEDGLITISSATAIPKLQLAVEQSISSVGTLSGHKCVMSYSRDNDGLFTIRINSVLIHAETDSRPFHRVSGIEDCNYTIGDASAGDVSHKLYTHLHFAKSLSGGTIERIHAELMSYYNII